ncbi:MAG: hypothetical protein KC420_00775 [Myxococcales bacterium]|nr:hypothetical protein [Myxococcales bacterium]MCB9568287.1 hypothetical protein [Myxococcales bacterium]MCB9705010.1 hypothetical protein [Myxococcales bacterium]
MDNPEFHDTQGSTGADASTSAASADATSAAGSGGGSDGGTTSGGASSEPATSSSGDPSTTADLTSTTSGNSSDATTSTTDPNTTDATTGTTGGVSCDAPEVLQIPAAADAFFIPNGTEGGLTCVYDILSADNPCKKLNFGMLDGLRLLRLDGGIDPMYAVRFQHQPLVDLTDMGMKVLDAALIVSVYDEIVVEGMKLKVAMIGEEWLEGNKPGTLAGDGDSSYLFRNVMAAAPWSGGDGPRGGSKEVATLPIPVGYAQNEKVASTNIDLTPWINDPNANNGLVVYFPAGTPVDTVGPGIKTRESANPPVLKIHYCSQ